MGRSYGMSATTLFWRVILPGALPSIFVGLRYALGIMWLTLIVAETISASSGIGYMAMQAREFLLVDIVVLSILIYALLGKISDSVTRLLERWCLSWHPAFQRTGEIDGMTIRARSADSDNFVELLPPAAGETARLRARRLRLTLRGLRKDFRQNRGSCAASISTFRAGEFVAIVGRSGCGKSTLLRLLLGLEQPSQGEYPLWSTASIRACRSGSIRIMFQEPRLLPWASVLANVEVGLGEQRVSANARDQAITTLREVGLEERRADWPSVLSGGQKQRVALARALVSHPRLLAFDEPLGALDALTRISMQRLIERVWLDQRFTAIMVTHDAAEAVTLADRILMIEDGQITLDHRIDLPRPRERGSPEVAALEGRVLRELFRNG